MEQKGKVSKIVEKKNLDKNDKSHVAHKKVVLPEKFRYELWDLQLWKVEQECGKIISQGRKPICSPPRASEKGNLSKKLCTSFISPNVQRAEYRGIFYFDILFPETNNNFLINWSTWLQIWLKIC